MGVLTMGVYRRFVREKKGMSTIFGGLFFIILILMGFNLMLWGFIQYDNYNTSTFKMSQNDQLASSENLVPTNPGAQNFSNTSPIGFNIPVNNLGGTTVSIARIYITNISPTGGSQCTSSGASAGPCVVDSGAGTQNCAGNGNCYFTNGNLGAGEINHLIHVSGIAINDGSGYKVILSSTRGRLFSFFYPWPVSLINNNPNGQFVTNIGPLSIYFDFKSFNFTQGSQTQSQSAFCMPSSTTTVIWVRLANTATDSVVTLQGSTMMQMQPYSANGFGQFVRTWIVSPTSINPASVAAYNQGTNPYTLPAATANGPASTVNVYFGGLSQGGTGGVSFSRDDNWLTFIGFYYNYRGQPQGETIPFMDFKTTSGYPGTC
jgi:hypothetical protein